MSREVPSREIRNWRSLLYVPVTVRHFVDKAHTRRADAVILDLEDGVRDADKTAARRVLPAAIERITAQGQAVAVRINKPLLWAVDDLRAAVTPDTRCIVLPKVESEGEVELFGDTVSSLEADIGLNEGSIAFMVLIETVRGLRRSRMIAQRCRRIELMSLGTEDFAASTFMEPTVDNMTAPCLEIVYAACEFDKVPIGVTGSIANFRDTGAFRNLCRSSRAVGLRGVDVIHPAQVDIVNEVFQPTEEEVAWARKVVSAYDNALASGVGAVDVDGLMIDAPIAARAREVLRTIVPGETDG